MAEKKVMKVLSAKEMTRIEALAIQEGASGRIFMEKAGEAIAKALFPFLPQKKESSFTIFLLIGKGKNGGDAYAAASHLLQKGFSVKAFALVPLEESSSEQQFFCKKFQKMGGEVLWVKMIEEVVFSEKGIIIDGIVGTGFEGALTGLFQEAAEKANRSQLPIFSVDIPSGVDGTTGQVKKAAIFAVQTLCLGAFKSGLFLGEGWNHVGRLCLLDFGLKEKFLDEAQEDFCLFPEENFPPLLPKIFRKRHKYQAGFVVGIAGSFEMAGAAHLSGLATLRAGAGIVRLFTSPRVKEKISFADELIVTSWQEKKELFEAIEKAKAVFVGPGLGRSKEAEELLSELLPQIKKPLVLDADGLFFLSKYPNTSLPKDTILTPHRKEMMRLLHLEKEGEEKEFFAQCQHFVEEKEVLLLLKGAPSFLFSPKKKPFILWHGDPGMATAGTGDVLTGILAALLAQNLSPFFAALLGAHLHALSGELAAKKKTSYALIASDIIEMLPQAFRQMMKMKKPDS